MCNNYTTMMFSTVWNGFHKRTRNCQRISDYPYVNYPGVQIKIPELEWMTIGIWHWLRGACMSIFLALLLYRYAIQRPLNDKLFVAFIHAFLWVLMVKCLQGQFKPTRVVLHLIILWCNKKKRKESGPYGKMSVSFSNGPWSLPQC